MKKTITPDLKVYVLTDLWVIAVGAERWCSSYTARAIPLATLHSPSLRQSLTHRVLFTAAGENDVRHTA
jgi:hypothetical protein